MKTPFPGMDPYLEHPMLWPEFQLRLIDRLCAQLQPLLNSRYVACLEQRVYVLKAADRHLRPARYIMVPRGQSPIAVAAAVVPADAEVSEQYIDILNCIDDRQPVTRIDLLSPSNKGQGSGREAYLAHQQSTQAAGLNLVEIDLLRTGEHVASVPALERASIPAPSDYLACVSRRSRRDRWELYAAGLQKRLPRIRIPLADRDRDVLLDLQSALERVYDESAYMLRVRYDEPCNPPLSPGDQQWAWECWRAYCNARPAECPPPSGQAPS